MDPLLNKLDCFLDRKYMCTGFTWSRDVFNNLARNSHEGQCVLRAHGEQVLADFLDRYFYQSIPHFDKRPEDRPPRKRALSRIDHVSEDDAEEHERKRHRTDPATITDDEIGKAWLRCQQCFTTLTTRDACYTRHGKLERDDVVCLPCWKKDYVETHCARCGAWGTLDNPIWSTHLCGTCNRESDPARVVRLRRRKDGTVVQNADVYIGRECRLGGWNLDASIWGNPFKLPKKATAEQVQDVLRKYEDHVRSQPVLMARVHELAGRTLGCFCAPKPCHGHVLAKLVHEWQLSKGIITE